MGDQVELTEEECAEIYDLLDSMSGLNGGGVTMTPTVSKIFDASGRNGKSSVADSGHQARKPFSKYWRASVENELFSLSCMAGRLGVTKAWLRDQADAGNVPGLKAGNRYLFNVAAVQEALGKAAREVEVRNEH